MNWLNFAYVACGGAVGSMARYWLIQTVAPQQKGDFPYAVLTVNILGSLLIGAWIAFMTSLPPAKARDLHVLLAVGVLGGFTTFSAFSLDVYLLLERGLAMQAFFYVAGSVFLSVLALMAGLQLCRWIMG